jgi:dihydrofolate reductase
MRKVITAAFVTLDGVMQAPGGPQEDPSGGFKLGGWLAPLGENDPVLGEEIGKLFGQKYDLLLGRRTYDIFASYWPSYDQNGPSAEIARQFNAVTKYVAPHSTKPLSWRGSVALHDAAKDVAKLKQEDGPALVTQGSGDLIQTLLKHDLIDELKLLTFPLILGSGKRLLREGVNPAAFKLASSRVSPNGMIAATYVRTGGVKTGDLSAR